MTVADVERVAADLGVYVGADWAGRPALSTVDAAAIVSGSARRDRDHEAAWRAHIVESEAWAAARDRLTADAGRGAYERAIRRGLGEPAAAAEAHDARVAAGRRYESSTPVPLFNGQDTGNAPRMYDSAGDEEV